MKDVNMAERMDAMQRMLLPTSALGDTLRQNACRFWENQDRVLDGMESLANGWFERRHVGTRAALEAAQRICKAETPVDILREYQAWVTGAVERVMADGLACQQQCMTIAGALAPSIPSPSGGTEPASSTVTPARSRAA